MEMSSKFSARALQILIEASENGILNMAFLNKLNILIFEQILFQRMLSEMTRNFCKPVKARIHG